MDDGIRDDATAGRASPKTVLILRAARRLFIACGFGATNMDAVAREAGVSKATVYAHFTSKEQLFIAIVEGECRRLQRAVPKSDLDIPVATALTRLGRRYLAFLIAPDVMALHRVIVAEAGRFPSLGRALFEAGPALMRGRIETYLRQATTRGQLAVDDPAQATSLLLGMMRGDIQLRSLLDTSWRPSSAEVTRQVEAACALFLRRYRPLPPGGDPTPR